jgi:hypothetical protein
MKESIWSSGVVILCKFVPEYIVGAGRVCDLDLVVGLSDMMAANEGMKEGMRLGISRRYLPLSTGRICFPLKSKPRRIAVQFWEITRDRDYVVLSISSAMPNTRQRSSPRTHREWFITHTIMVCRSHTAATSPGRVKQVCLDKIEGLVHVSRYVTSHLPKLPSCRNPGTTAPDWQ